MNGQDVLPGVYYGLYKGEALAFKGEAPFGYVASVRTCLR